MKILHIKGTMCSGKTYTIKPFLEYPDIAYWDIMDFYEKTGCVVDGDMDWTKWDIEKHKIEGVLEKFLGKCERNNKIAIVESGTNATVKIYTPLKEL